MLSEKARAFYPSEIRHDQDNFDLKATMVEPLARGLQKMQQGVTPTSSHAKMAHQVTGDFEQVEPGAERKHDDPAYQRAAEKLQDIEDESGDAGRDGRDQSFWRRMRSTR